MAHLFSACDLTRTPQAQTYAGSPLREAFVALALLSFAGASAAQTTPGKPYANDRYGYSFFLPADLNLTHGQAGEAVLRSNDGATTVQINPTSESRPGFPGNDPDTEGEADAKDCDHLPPPYVLKKQDVVAFSCPKGPTIHYAIIRYTATGSVSMDATYPASQRAHWDPLISKIATSLKRTR